MKERLSLGVSPLQVVEVTQIASRLQYMPTGLGGELLVDAQGVSEERLGLGVTSPCQQIARRVVEQSGGFWFDQRPLGSSEVQARA